MCSAILRASLVLLQAVADLLQCECLEGGTPAKEVLSAITIGTERLWLVLLPFLHG